MQRIILFFLMLSVLLGGCAAPGAVSKGIPTDISVIDTDYKLSWLITREDFVLDDAGEKQYTGGGLYLRTLDFASGETTDTYLSAEDDRMLVHADAPEGFAAVEMPELPDGTGFAEWADYSVYHDGARLLSVAGGKTLSAADYDCDVLCFFPDGRVAGCRKNGENHIFGVENPDGSWIPLLETGKDCEVKEITHACWENETGLLLGLRTGKRGKIGLYRCDPEKRTLESVKNEKGKTISLPGSGLDFHCSMSLSPDGKCLVLRIADSDYPGLLHPEVIMAALSLQSGEICRFFKVGTVSNGKTGSFEDCSWNCSAQFWHLLDF